MYKIAYFSAEIGISSGLPTYSGGLGVLAGDHIKAAADCRLPICAVTLLYKEGYFKQRVDEEGNQSETYPRFDPSQVMEKLPVNLTLPLQGREVHIQAWQYTYRGIDGAQVPIFLLDTDVPVNTDADRHITMRLYSGDKNHRIMQEAILGFGGIRLLETLGIDQIETYHMNEGHCSFLTLELLRKFNGDEQAVRDRCVFTTHTPVSAGHDHFALERCKNLLDGLIPDDLKLPAMVQNSRLHMTELGLYFSRTANGVSKLHGSVAREQFPQFTIDHITNGVYHNYWVGKPFRELYDQVFPGWRQNPELLLQVDEIPDEEILAAHNSLKNFLLGYANSQRQKALAQNVLTIGFARRAASYKRARLIFRDMDRLERIATGRLQIIFAGKAHPRDDHGKEILHDIVARANQLFGKVKIVFLENYNMWLGRLITSGVDVWLNTPVRPREASGTSGMKATLNGIPNLSIMDGWWSEGCEDGVNGWSIGGDENSSDQADADHLYRRLENDVIPLFYDQPDQWVKIMRAAIKTGVRFTAHRMISEYREKLYHPEPKH